MLIIETSFGPVPVWGRFEEPGGPLLFVIRGVGGVQRQLEWVLENLEGDVAFVQLPGIHSPPFRRNSIEDFAAAFDEVLAEFGRPVVVAGVSMGGVAALALRHPAIQRLVLIDTPLRTGDLWPLEELLGLMGRDSPDTLQWLADILGYSPDRWVNRDYRPLLSRLQVPATVLLASEPLHPRRTITRTPSLVAPEDQVLYGSTPGVKALTIPDTGHHLAASAPSVIIRCLRWALDQTISPALSALSQ